jgi:hypothetical protein
MPNAAPLLGAPATTVITNQEQPPQPSSVLRSAVVLETSPAYWATRRMSPYEQRAEPLTMLSAGVPDTPTTISTLTEQAVGQWQGEQPATVPPNVGDTGGSALPDPTGLEGAEVKTAAGTLTHEAAAGLQGAEVKTTATANAELPISVTFTAGSSLTAEATVIPAVKEPPEPDTGILPATAEQRPAAYRFGVRDGKIDVLPELPEPEDRGFALDTYQELVAKARELHERLKGTNSARRVCDSVERLLTALGTRFDDLNAGVLLSRSRSIEADRAAFGDELFPDTIAMLDDTARTLRDLLASFPSVRRIEAEVLALDLDRHADAIPAIREQMAAIEAAAEKSYAVTAEAIGALTQIDAATEDAIDPIVQRSLVADKLLVFRNFAGAVIRAVASSGRGALAKAKTELGELSGDIWEEIRASLPKGAGMAARAVPPLALVGLAIWITDPVTGIAAAVAAFKPMAQILKGFARDEKAPKQPKRGKGR